MSTLSDKINSYAIELGIEFNQSYSLPPTTTGSLSVATGWAMSSTPTPTFESAVGPISGAGSWKFSSGPTSGSMRLRNTNSNLLNTIYDRDFSVGFWVKLNSLPTDNTFGGPLISMPPFNSNGFQFGVRGPDGSGKSYFYIDSDGTNTSITSVEANTTDWFYLAFRHTGNAATTNAGQWLAYINGQLVSTVTNYTPTNPATSANWGSVSQGYEFSMNIANWYMTTKDVIGAAEIAEIWTAGTVPPVNNTIAASPALATALFVDPVISGNVNFVQTAITASALQTDSTIVIVANDNVQVTTSISVSATMPNAVVQTGQFINFIVTQILTASTIIGDNIIVSAGTNASISSTEMTATALFTEARVSEVPMTASATMPNAVLSITPNYFNLVKTINPYLYINSGDASPVNYGYQSGTFVKGAQLSTVTDGGAPMNLIGEGKSWLGSGANNSNGFFTFETTNYANSFNSLIGTGNFAYEVWVKPRQLPNGAELLTRDESTFPPLLAILNAEKLKIWLDDGVTASNGAVTPRYFSLFINNNLNTSVELRADIDPTFALNNWNHVVVNVYQSGINANQRLVQLWVNGQILINQNIAFTTWSDTTDKINYVLGSNAVGLAYLSDMYYDELAIYSSPLTNSQILQHNQFISTQSPDRNMFQQSFTVNMTSGDHNFLVQSNTIISETPATSSALIVHPSIIGQKVVNVNATAITASATNTDVVVYYGRTMTATPMIVYSESVNAFRLSDTYSAYVQTNIAPYRYVTFDANDSYVDSGSDADYSVIPTVVGGTIVNPDVGINGKSAKTAGTSYVTDGAILKESEWNDSWGTGANDWHSAFWFQRALDDNSTTGLRVLWNLNGYKDNQHAVLYQYQGRLHMQFNNGSGTFIETDSTALDLFDYNRHFVVIDHNHGGGSTNTIKLYVDSVLRFTVNIGSITPTTTNAATADSGPNDEANNRPRLSIGCLITPFASTALPVQPTNTRLAVDEIYWDKNSITQTQVTNLYNSMPDKNNKTIVAEPFTASDELVMPGISRSSILSTAALTASASLVEPQISANREVITAATVLTASALAGNATVFEDRIILSDIMVASAIFNSAGAKITIPGGPMLASAIIVNRLLGDNPNNITLGAGIRVNGNSSWSRIQPWATWLRATDSNSIIPMKEVV